MALLTKNVIKAPKQYENADVSAVCGVLVQH